jgi:hypothetical protein
MSDPTAPDVPPPAEPPAPEPAPAAVPGRRRWLGLKRWQLGLGAVLLAPLLLFLLYTAVVLNWSYSEGVRAGYLQKFSRKGWLCKTWEGELALTTVPGVAPVLWNFTVRNDAAARQLNIALGRRVLLFYQEHRGIPTRCFGDTNYFVDSVKIVQ